MIRVYLSGDPVHDRVLEAFYEGCPLEKQFVRGFKYEPSELAVIFGMYKSKIPKSHPRGKVFQRQREKNLDVIVLETGYVNRGDGPNHHYAVGFNGLNGRADFRNKSSPDTRWNMLGVPLRPYSRGSKVILCGQVPWDASVDMHDHVKWLKQTASQIQKVTDKTVVFRPHPKAPLANLYGCEFSQKPLEEDLKDAHCVVAWSSNVAVDAVISGVPVFCSVVSAARPVSGSLEVLDIENPATPDREAWVNSLAYGQFEKLEIEDGTA